MPGSERSINVMLVVKILLNAVVLGDDRRLMSDHVVRSSRHDERYSDIRREWVREALERLSFYVRERCVGEKEGKYMLVRKKRKEKSG